MLVSSLVCIFFCSANKLTPQPIRLRQLCEQFIFYKLKANVFFFVVCIGRLLFISVIIIPSLLLSLQYTVIAKKSFFLSWITHRQSLFVIQLNPDNQCQKQYANRVQIIDKFLSEAAVTAYKKCYIVCFFFYYYSEESLLRRIRL